MFRPSSEAKRLPWTRSLRRLSCGTGHAEKRLDSLRFGLDSRLKGHGTAAFAARRGGAVGYVPYMLGYMPYIGYNAIIG